MRWSIDTNDPPLAQAGGRILCDGDEVQRATAFDTDEGWVDALCIAGCGGVRVGAAHVNPEDRSSVCRAPRRHGAVEYIPPEGGSGA